MFNNEINEACTIRSSENIGDNVGWYAARPLGSMVDNIHLLKPSGNMADNWKISVLYGH